MSVHIHYTCTGVELFHCTMRLGLYLDVTFVYVKPNKYRTLQKRIF